MHAGEWCRRKSIARVRQVLADTHELRTRGLDGEAGS
jgi:hypothetical protein